MHVLHIMASRGLGGAETYFADLVAALAENGVRQTAVMARGAHAIPMLRAAGVNVVTAPLDLPFTFMQRAVIAKVIRQDMPELIHTWMRRGASLVPANLQQPVIGWFGGYYDVRHFSRCTHFVGVTEDIARHIRASGPNAEHVFHQPTFARMDMNVAATPRAALDTPEGKPLILVLARLHPKKGLDTLLDALHALPDTYLWIAGDGPLESALKMQARKLGLEPRVRFLGWRDDRAALLKACDVLAVPSRYEPFGTVVVEGWMADKPVVAAAAVGPAATVADGQTGLLVPVDDAPALANALRRALTDMALRETLVRNGRAVYQTNWSQPAAVARMTALYEHILHRRH